MALIDKITAYYKLDESSGNPVDSSGNGYTLTNSNVTFGAAKINNGAIFNSNTDRLINNSLAINNSPTGKFGVSGWVKINTAPSSSSQQTIFDASSNGKRDSIFRYVDDSGTKKVQISNYDGSTEQKSAITYTLTVGNWYHFVVNYDTQVYTVYINNSNIGGLTATNNNTVATTSFSLGIHPTAAVVNLLGELDEIAVSINDTFTTGEIAELYNSGNGLQYPFAVGSSKFFQLF